MCEEQNKNEKNEGDVPEELLKTMTWMVLIILNTMGGDAEAGLAALHGA